jgi:hypothetical protein
MNERELNSGLRQLISRGEIELEMTDERVDCLLGQHLPEPNERLERLKARLTTQIQNDAIEKGRTAVGSKILPFGRFIEAIRDEAKLTRLEIANRLYKDEAFVSRIERGDQPSIRHYERKHRCQRDKTRFEGGGAFTWRFTS